MYPPRQPSLRDFATSVIVGFTFQIWIRAGQALYTRISDQYVMFSSQVVNVGVRDSTYVPDGLLNRESDLLIEEHYIDTAGFTDHVFALMHLLGFRFAPRIRNLSGTKRYPPPGKSKYQALEAMAGACSLSGTATWK